MALFTVYHLTVDADLVNAKGWGAAPNYLTLSTQFNADNDAIKEILFSDTCMENFVKVATVEVDGLDDVFGATNHIESNWLEGESVRDIFADKAKTRSTSVGDFIVDMEGRAFRVESFGHKDLGIFHKLG